jgi:hypothetical protein
VAAPVATPYEPAPEPSAPTPNPQQDLAWDTPEDETP